MQDDAVEVAFCDLCGTSVPVNDLQAGAAVRHQGKVVGSCCLATLRGSRPAAPAAPVASGPPPAGEARFFPVAVLLLVAIAAATLFLDLQVSAADARWRQAHEQVQQGVGGALGQLQALAVLMDGAARRADVDGVASKVQDSVAALAAAQGKQGEAGESLQRELASLQQVVRGLATQSVDYRPLFEEMRQRQQRLLEQMATLREVGGGASAPSAPSIPAAEPPAAEAAGPALPPALAEHVKKLQSAEAAVRFEAVDELLRSKNPDVLPKLLSMAKDPDAYVRRLTVDGLRDWKRADVVEVLLAALADNEENVRDTAFVSLKLVTGQKLAFDPTATKEARGRAIQRWTEWWEKNKASFGS